MDRTPEDLDELAHCAFTLAEQYPPSTSGISPNMPSDMKHRFAAVLYPTDTEFSPVKAILHQNPPSRPARVVVDFQTRTAVCEDQEANLPIEPEQIDRVHGEIKLQTRGVWERNKKARQLETQVDWTDFLQHLESRGMIPAKSYSDSSTHKPCPLCDNLTARCRLCLAIMCLNRECVVSQLIPSQSCSQHVSWAICLPCLENPGFQTCFAQCPQCELWFCGSDLTWCLGRPKDLSNRSPDTNPHDILGSPREHPAKPIRCFLCVGGQGQPHCADRDCWSTSRGIHTSICDSCLPGGLWCVCKQHWICGVCRTSPLDNSFKDCPRCRRTYCPDACNYIGFCANCGRTTLCSDCFEEDWSCSAGPNVVDDVIQLTGRCDELNCWKRICRECLEGARCVGCGRTVCISHTPQIDGDPSDGHRCFHCIY